MKVGFATRLKGVFSQKFARLGWEFFLISLGQVATVAGSIIGVKLLTSIMEPEIYGEVSLGIAFATMNHAIFLSPLASSATRFFASAREQGSLKVFLKAVASLAAKASGITSLVCMAIMLLLSSQSNFRWNLLIIASGAFSVCLGANGILAGMQNAARQRGVVAFHGGLAAFLKFGFAILLVNQFGSFAWNALVGYCLAMIFITLSQGFFFFRLFKQSSNNETKPLSDYKDWKTRIFSYAWPFASWGVLESFSLTAGRWSLQTFGSAQQVGLYAVLYQMGFYPVNLACNLLVQLIAPVLFQRAGVCDDKKKLRKVCALVKKLTIGGVLFTVSTSAIVHLLHSQIFALLVGTKYQPVSYLLAGTTMGGGLFATAQIAALGPLCSSNSKSMIKPKVVSSVMGIVLSFLGAGLAGIEGVVWAHIASSAIFLLWMVALTWSGNNSQMNSGEAENDREG